MCGIAGFTHTDRVVEPGQIEEVALTLVHRGPDHQDVYRSRTASLAAVRLRIIDLEGGDQPMTAAGVTIAFNGEIYNHGELREELRRRGHSFESRSDTEVVLRAFLEWDTACFERLRGMFAIALWNDKRRRLVLARDRVGIKPLYVCRHGRDLYFGSELKAIFANPEIDRRLDPEALNHYLSLNYVPGEDTLVAGIKKLAPGHWLEWHEGRTAIHRYWRPAFRVRQRTVGEAKEELDALLRSAVREHLISDVPLGVWLSGGLDSSTVLHYAAENSPAQLRTFSVSFAGRSFDERRYFRPVAVRYATDHHEFDLNPNAADLTSAVESLVYHSDEPSADAGALPVWFLSKMSRQHVTVALSGEGADELFGGYVTYVADRWARRLAAIPPAIRSLAARAAHAALPVSDEKVGFEYKLKRLLEGTLLDADHAHCYWNGTFSSAQKRTLLTGAPADGLGSLFARVQPDATGLNRYLCFDQNYYLPDDILNKCDRVSMAHSLEVRPPFLDHRIVEFAASLPENFKVRGGRLKYVLRALMKEKLPGAVIRRPKQGFDIPAHEWLRGPLRDLLVWTLSPAAIRKTGLFETEQVATLVRRHLAREINVGYHLWGLLILQLWIERWKIQAQPAEALARHENALAAAMSCSS